MVFNSLNYLLFLPVVIAIYFLLPRITLKNIWLLAASYWFYSIWSPSLVVLMIIATMIGYGGGIALNKLNIQAKNKPENKKTIKKMQKIILAITILLVLSLLLYFKYAKFIINNINIILSELNIKLIDDSFNIMLPIGISYYTFQIIAYLVDVYRKDAKAETNLLYFALFIAFFPKIVAGPIERANNLLTQLKENHKFNYENMKNGLLLMLFGYFLKMVIADRAAVYVNFIFDNYEAFTGWQIFYGALLYSIQGYTDFYGYTCLALGSAEIMGIYLLKNFNHPFFACSVTDYWKRWHLSLSSFLRDYIFYPLTLSSKNSHLKIIHYRNIIITFCISGLWHGANWTYIMWGFCHGVLMVLENMTKNIRNKIFKFFHIDTTSFSFRLEAIIYALLVLTFTRLFFRAPDISTSFAMIKQMFSEWNPHIFIDGSLIYIAGMDAKEFIVLWLAIFVLWAISMLQEHGIKIRHTLSAQNLLFRWFIYIVAIVIIIVFGVYGEKYDASQFIYFRF